MSGQIPEKRRVAPRRVISKGILSRYVRVTLKGILESVCYSYTTATIWSVSHKRPWLHFLFCFRLHTVNAVSRGTLNSKVFPREEEDHNGNRQSRCEGLSCWLKILRLCTKITPISLTVLRFLMLLLFRICNTAFSSPAANVHSL